MNMREMRGGALARQEARGKEALLFEELLDAAKRASPRDVSALLAVISEKMDGSDRLVRWEVNLREAINCAAQRGDASTLAPLIGQIWPQVEKNYSVAQCFNEALMTAASNGWDECARLLLDASSRARSPSRLRANSDALGEAAHRGRLGCVEMLIPVSNPSGSFSRALAMAAEGGSIECAKALIPHSNPSEAGCNALKRAAESGKLAAVELLAPLSSDDQRMEALKSAARDGMIDCMRHILRWHMEKNRPQDLLGVAICQGLRQAAIHGQEACVAALLQIVQPVEGQPGLRSIAREALHRGRAATANMVSAFADMAEALAERAQLEKAAPESREAMGGAAAGKLRL